jgi:simple sugar transport system ATP-binding protein
VLGQLRGEGKTILFITHKLREIMAITDRVSVMRRGEIVNTLDTRSTNPEQLAEMMVGRSVRLRVDKQPRAPGAPVIEVESLSASDSRGVQRVNGVSFSVCEGEIVGIAGVAGNGQTELLEVLSGIRPRTSGTFRLKGADVGSASPRQLRKRHCAHVPEDRHRMGLVMPFAANENAILGYHDDARFSPRGMLDRSAILTDTEEKMERFDIRPPNPRLRAALFSGGNQQKLVIARELERDPAFLIVGQPTRGVDIGAIEFIHKRLVALRDAGKAILLVSVELDEIRALADRILVMFDGHIVGERGAGASEQELGLLMAGVTDKPGGGPGAPAQRVASEAVNGVAR